ncbi:MAG: radical SAM protein [Desulfobacterales bacterium]|nr:radical SAM protein [Desulfobacterales bacterium]
MKFHDYITCIGPRALNYMAARHGLTRAANPLTLTFSVTAACRSRCRTCNIGKRYLADPKIIRQNLALDEIETVFKSLGHIYFFNISGGEPFMRPDLAEIIRLACLYLKPRLIHIPTNALAPNTIEKITRRILVVLDEYAPLSVPISIKPSIDGIGAAHDSIRGVKGNFAALEQTIDLLLALALENPRLHVDLGTVISNYNIHHLDEIEDWVHGRGIESYRHEIAEQRAEFDNLGDPITPTVARYEKLVKGFKEKIFQNIRGKAFLTRTTEAVRLVYYDVAVRILKERRQVTPCLAGIANIHLNYNGEVWPCCVLGNEQALGNVRESGLDMREVLGSKQAKQARQYIADGNCACPLANQWLNNILLTPRHMVKVLYTLGLLFPFRAGTGPVGGRSGRVTGGAGEKKDRPAGGRHRAMVLKKFGTIPGGDEEVELPAEPPEPVKIDNPL